MNTAMFLACKTAGRNFKFQSPRQKKNHHACIQGSLLIRIQSRPMKASQYDGTTFDYLAEEYSSPLGNPLAGHTSFRQHLWQTTSLSPQPQSLHQQQFQFTMQQQEQNHVIISSSPANQAIKKGVPCQNQSKVIFQVLLDTMQASSLVKRARRWPDMGVVSKIRS